MKETNETDPAEGLPPPPAPMMTLSPNTRMALSALFGAVVAGLGLWAGHSISPDAPPAPGGYYQTPSAQVWNTMWLWTGVSSSFILWARLPTREFPRPKTKDLIAYAVATLLVSMVFALVMTFICDVQDEFAHEDNSM